MIKDYTSHEAYGSFLITLLLAALLAAFLFIGTAAAEEMLTADEQPVGTVIEKPTIEIIETPIEVIEKPTVEIIKKPVFVPRTKAKVGYTPVDLSSDIIKAIKQIIGITPKEHTVKVTIKDVEVAVLPEDSPLVGMDIYEECSKFYYGTDVWQQCEARVSEQEIASKEAINRDNSFEATL